MRRGGVRYVLLPTPWEFMSDEEKSYGFFWWLGFYDYYLTQPEEFTNG